ncbi:MAG: CDP-alcohol phosphatidyltransferase family protein [Thaumarchaeota archaeon]|nr:CDP-alcohol phosphatidyltransferase family protein [Nitrososphaerota archaeon]
MNTKHSTRTYSLHSWVRRWGSPLLVRPARFIGSIGITPNSLTLISFLLNILTALLVIVTQLQLAAFMVLLAGALDILDGPVARETGTETPFGAILDSVLDQYGEVMILASLLPQYLHSEGYVEVMLIVASVAGVLLTSYVRARSEWLGIECRVGLLTHFERVIIIALGLITTWMTVALWVLAIFSNVTAVQRIAYVWRSLQDKSSTPRS